MHTASIDLTPEQAQTLRAAQTAGTLFPFVRNVTRARTGAVNVMVAVWSDRDVLSVSSGRLDCVTLHQIGEEAVAVLGTFGSELPKADRQVEAKARVRIPAGHAGNRKVERWVRRDLWTRDGEGSDVYAWFYGRRYRVTPCQKDYGVWVLMPKHLEG